MCRWHEMTRREKCRCISVALVFLLGVAGVVAFIYGGVNIYRVSREAATNDGVANQLSEFYKCCEACSSLPQGKEDPLCHLVKRNCGARQAPALVPFGFAAAFTILALLVAPCAFKKDQWFGFGVLSSLAITCTLIAAVVVGSHALPVAAQFADCSKFDANTISEVANMGMICIKTPNSDGGVDVKQSAAKWMCKLCTFFAGAGVNVATMLLFMLIKRCCCCKPCGNEAGGCQRQCMFARCFSRLRSRFCSRAAHTPLASSADRDDGVPVSAPSYYDVSDREGGAAAGASASEDAGASPSSTYRAYGVQ